MSATTDPTTLAITGELPSVLLGGALLALPVSLLLLWLYRRAVLRSMNTAARGGDATATSAHGGGGTGQRAEHRVRRRTLRRECRTRDPGRDARTLARRGHLRSRRGGIRLRDVGAVDRVHRRRRRRAGEARDVLLDLPVAGRHRGRNRGRHDARRAPQAARRIRRRVRAARGHRARAQPGSPLVRSGGLLGHHQRRGDCAAVPLSCPSDPRRRTPGRDLRRSGPGRQLARAQRGGRKRRPDARGGRGRRAPRPRRHGDLRVHARVRLRALRPRRLDRAAPARAALPAQAALRRIAHDRYGVPVLRHQPVGRLRLRRRDLGGDGARRVPRLQARHDRRLRIAPAPPGAGTAPAAAAPRLRARQPLGTVLRRAARALAAPRERVDDRRPGSRHEHRGAARVPRVRERRARRALRHRPPRPRAADRGDRPRARPRRPLSRERVLLPRRHLADDDAPARRGERRRPDGPAQLRARQPRLRVRARRAAPGDRARTRGIRGRPHHRSRFPRGDAARALVGGRARLSQPPLAGTDRAPARGGAQHRRRDPRPDGDAARRGRAAPGARCRRGDSGAAHAAPGR